MGHGQSINTSSSRNASVTSESGFSSTGGRQKHGKEHKRHGVVTLKMVVSNPTRRANDQVVTHTITPKGCILYGSQAFEPTVVQQAISTSGYPIVAPSSLQLADNRAHKILVSYCRGWHIVPFPEIFSRHSGTCLILGDRTIQSPPFQIKVGDCFRLGSVGLVVSEMRADGEIEQRIDAKTLEFLKDEALAFDTNGDMATLAADEERQGQDALDTTYEDDPDQPPSPHSLHTHNNTNNNNTDNEGDGCATPPRGTSLDSAGGTPLHFEDVASPEYVKPAKRKSVDKNLGFGGISPGERFVCYMCYETHDTEEDALVAPCDCRGDTRYLHVQCLQKWYQASITGVQTQVIRTTGNGAPACKICGSAYKTAFRRADGRKASLLETESNGPYLSLVVVTKHDTNPGLFNTKFRLNFHSRAEAAQNALIDNQEDNVITIGRSSSCNMILDYRTVSTIHARITYEADGKFYLSDRRSSNGTMVYLQDPFPLPYNHSLKLRMGRTTLSLQAKRNWTSSLRTLLGTSLPSSEALSPTPEDIQTILSNCAVAEDHEQHTVKEDALNMEDEQRRDEESPNGVHGNNNNPVQGSRGGLYLRTNLPDGAEPDSDLDHSVDTHNNNNNTATNLHTTTMTHTNVHGALLTTSQRNLHESQRNDEGSLRTIGSNNTNFNSVHSSMTGVTANTNNHPYATLPYNSTQYNSHSTRTPLNGTNANGTNEEGYVGLHDVHGLAMSAEERQEQADLERAIQLSLLEQQGKEPGNTTTTNTTNNANNNTHNNNITNDPNTDNTKDEPLFLTTNSRSNSSRAYTPSSPNTKTPNTHVSLNRTYTEFSEGEHGIASFAASMNNNTTTNNNTSNTANNDNRKMSASTTPPRSRQTSQGNVGIGEYINTGSMPRSPSKALTDFSQPDVVGDEHSGSSAAFERPPSRHLSGTSSPAYNNVSVLSNGSGRIVMHDTTEAEPISTEGVTAGEGYLYSGRSSGTNAGSIHSGSGKHSANTINTSNTSANNTTVHGDELSTSMPIAGAFTPFGQMSHRKSTQNLATDNNTTNNGNTSNANNITTSNNTYNTPNNTATTNNTHSSTTPPTMEPIKESSTNSLYLSKEHSFAKNNTATTNTNNTNTATNNTNTATAATTNTTTNVNPTSNTTAPLEKQRSVKGAEYSGSSYSGGGNGGNESPTLLRNTTTLDLHPDQEEDEQK